jgi:SAM-dependent methyltransferase
VAVDFRVLDALHLGDLSQTFDAVIDSGLFHVFNDDDRRRYVAALAAVLRPGGRLFMMCFSDEEPGTFGPRRIAEADLREAFADGWVIESATPARFATIGEFVDQFSPGGPKAWFVVARKT